MLNDFSLLETILYTPQQDFYLLDLHLKRLQDAIKDFQNIDSTLFPNPPTNQSIVEKLDSTISKANSYQRVRLLVDCINSHVTIQHTPLLAPEYSNDTLDQAALLKPMANIVLDIKPIHSQLYSHNNTDDPFIMHKTTRRDMYDISRKRTCCDYNANVDDSNVPFDVILYNPEKEITETSIANIAVQFRVDDKLVWKTPSLKCGLLPGVFRSYLLSEQESNNLVEDVITIDELIDAKKV